MEFVIVVSLDKNNAYKGIKMNLNEKLQLAGLCNISELAEHIGVPESTVLDWDSKNQKLLNIVIRGVISENKFRNFFLQNESIKFLVIHIHTRYKLGEKFVGYRILAEEVGISKSTIREHLASLAGYGFLKIQHGKPTQFICNFPEDLLEEIK
jgi:predicted transcriptional regulator